MDFSAGMEFLKAVIAICILDHAAKGRFESMLLEPMSRSLLMGSKHIRANSTCEWLGTIKRWSQCRWKVESMSVIRILKQNSLNDTIKIRRAVCNEVVPDTNVSTGIWKVIQKGTDTLDVFEITNDESTPSHIALNAELICNHFFKKGGEHVL